jgi:Dolichyl-phosphate-mannose-protein mannosyltransferase
MFEDRSSSRSFLIGAFLLIGLGILAGGLWSSDVIVSHPWFDATLYDVHRLLSRFGTGLGSDRPWPPGAGFPVRFAMFTLVALVIALAIVLLMRRHWRPALVAALGLWMVVAIGIGPVVVILFLGISALATGELLFGGYWEERFDPITGAVLSMLVGSAGWIWLLGFLVHRPVNTPGIYLILFLTPILVGRRRILMHGQRIRDWIAEPADVGNPTRAVAALFVCILAVHLVNVAMPDHTGDADLIHMRVGAELAYFHRWSFDFENLVVAVMPMGSDLALGAAYLLGGPVAAKLPNFGFFLAAVALIYMEARRNYGGLAAILAAALYASIPVMFYETATTFADNTTTAFLLGAAIVQLRCGDNLRSRDVILIGLLLGSGLYTKFTAGVFCACLAILLLYGMYRSRMRVGQALRTLLLAGGLGVLVAVPPYLYAYRVTGNPVYPFYNAIFQSKYFDATKNFIHFRPSVSWDLLYRMTFHSNKFFEGGNGAFGFLFVTLLLAGIGLAILQRDRVALTAAALGLGYFYLLSAGTAHVRYSLPAMPLLTLVCCGIFSYRGGLVPILRTLAVACGIFLIVLDLGYFPVADSSLRDFRAEVVIRGPEQTREYVDSLIAWRRLVRIVNAMPVERRVLMPGTGSELHGLRLIDDWYNPVLRERLTSAQTPAEMLRIFTDYRITHAMIWYGAPWERMRLQCYILENTSTLTADVPRNAYLYTVNSKKEAEFRPQDDKAWQAYKNGPPRPGCIPPNQ